MDSYHICGGRKIRGETNISGAKNAALPILAASVITKDKNCFINCPHISDVDNMLEILKAIGCRIEESKSGERALCVDSSSITSCEIPQDLMRVMRSSVFLMGPILAVCGEAILGKPGGCNIGARPIDIHLSALKKLGVSIREEDNQLICKAEKLVGDYIKLDFPSVGATENVMLTALGARGETIIDNCAMEPEIVDLQNYLISCGAQISGAGTRKIVVCGEKRLNGTEHKIIPDRIVGGTYLLAAAITGGEILIKGANPDHMKTLLHIVEAAGCTVKSHENQVYLSASKRLLAVPQVTTGTYPGFPTDMQSQLVAAMTVAKGKSRVTEVIFENRFRYVSQLKKMGADIEVSEKSAIISGVSSLKGQKVSAGDLRGGAALVLAALAAEGISVVENISHIKRGYENFDKMMRELGAEIELV